MKIRFGTSGWRAIIAQEFTFRNVELVIESICRYLTTEQPEAGRPIIIGHDSRFMGETFARRAAEVAARKGFTVLLCEGPTPTPAVSFAIRSVKAAGGVNFTASHNPPEYQGIKFSTGDGAPALPEVTSSIEEHVREGVEEPDRPGGEIRRYDPCRDYLADLKNKIRFSEIRSGGCRIAYDPLWGTGRGYLDRVLREEGIAVETLHDWRDVTFGGMPPEPGRKQLELLARTVVEKELTIGLSTDGDGDRFGVIDSNGAFIEANQLLAVLTDYLAESRGWKEGVARSVATTGLLDRVAASHGLDLYETPVGFKYIGALINEGKIILGGEESAGLSIKGHYPEKDGILACLLAAEAVAARDAGLSEQLKELLKSLGNVESGRIGVKLTDDIAVRLKQKLAQDPAEIGGRKIENINRLDGVKFEFAGNAWMLLRPSGTEPLVRIYAESEDSKDLEELLEQGRKYLLE